MITPRVSRVGGWFAVKRGGLFVLCLCAATARPDVLVLPQRYDQPTIGASVEVIMSVEPVVARRFSVPGWFGVGHLLGIYPNVAFGFGAECAVAFRYYPFSDSARSLFVGVYSGVSLMGGMSQRAFYGMACGVKLGYKAVVADFNRGQIAFEPYTSLSVAPVDFVFDRYFEDVMAGRLWTLGLRIVWQWHRPYPKYHAEVKEV
jgi:tetrahydromethanopterin S-methyltransferase subunit B